MKKNLKPYAYKQREGYASNGMPDFVLFVERAGELRYSSEVKILRIGAAAKASFKRAF